MNTKKGTVIVLQDFQRNKKCFTGLTLCSRFILFLFINIIFLQDKGLSFKQIFILNALESCISFITEVPSGMLADKFGGKKILIFSQIFKFISLILLFGNNFIFFIVHSVFWGLADSFESGTSTALLYDNFTYYNKTNEFKDYSSKIYSITFLSTAIATMIAPIIMDVNVDYPIILSLIMIILSFIFIIKFKEINLKEVVLSTNDIKMHHNMGLKELLKETKLISLFLYSVIVTLILANLNALMQPYIMERGINLKQLGILMFVFYFLMSIGAKFSNKIKINKNLVILMLGIILILLRINNPILIIILFGLARILNGYILPTLSAEINDCIKVNNRVTLLSYKNLLFQLLSMLTDPLVGIIVDRSGIELFYFYLGLTLIVMILILSIYIYLKKEKDKKEAIF